MNPSQAAKPPSRPARRCPDRDAELARRGAREQVGHCNELGELPFREPAPALDVLVAEVADVRDRPTERGQPEPQGDAEDLGQTTAGPRA